MRAQGVAIAFKTRTTIRVLWWAGQYRDPPAAVGDEVFGDST